MSTGTAAALHLPRGTVVHDHQVAGHIFQDGKPTIGMLKQPRDGCILKAANKPVCGRREIEFYERVNGGRGGGGSVEADAELEELRQLMPEYRGTVQIQMDTSTIDFIRLADITAGMTEPCVIDIKIGRRTWDPLATIEKIAAEESKYQACKQTLGLCVPGFQVYSVKTGQCKRYGKEYGKGLDERTVKNALSQFLNVEHGLCRPLLVQILSGLWRIQKWARSQRSLRLYSSSILIAYDARLLRNSLDVQRKANQLSPFAAAASPGHSPKSLGRHGSLSTPSPRDLSPFDWNASPTATASKLMAGAAHQTSNGGSPVGSVGSGADLMQSSPSPTTPTATTVVDEMYRKVQRNHSVRNNYDEDLKAIRENYALALDNLIGGFRSAEWVHVRMIDFAHVFEAEAAARAADERDENYLFGVESVVRLFEEYLRDCQ